MAHQIIAQPGGKLCVWDSTVDAIVLYDATAEDLLDLYADKAAQEARRTMSKVINRVSAGQARLVYHHWTLTYQQALERSAA